jgi:WS/DGAT/MGAT family acyltransferase
MTRQPPQADGRLHWGEAREMNAIETLMWRVEADPRLRSTISGIEILDCTPNWERFLAAAEWGTRMAPRFRQKVVEPALGIGNPSWVNDPDFDLHYHVRRMRLPEGGGWRALFATAEQIAMTPFDRARSPWESYLIEGLPDRRAAHFLKMHHAMTDGMGSVQLFSQLHSRTRESNPFKPQPSPPLPERQTPVGLLLEQLARDVQAIPGVAQSAASAAFRTLRHPWATAASLLTFVGSLSRVTAEPGAKGSPLLRRRSLSWHFMALDVAFADLRAAAKAADASINDAFVAALLGAFRLYHEALNHPITELPMAIPISVRREGDAAGGNRIAGVRFTGPVGIADPRRRMRAIGDRVGSIRREPGLDGMSVLAPALARLPAALLTAIAGGMTKANDLQASNVPGLREDLYLAGALVERAYGFGPLPGCATMITLTTHRDTCCIAANVDPAAVTEPELFARCLERGFAEVLALHPGSAPPLRRI